MVEEEEKIKDFPSWIYENLSRTKSAKELHIERKQKDKTIQSTPCPTYRKVSYTWFACNSCNGKNAWKMSLKSIITLFMGLLIKIIPKETPIRPIQCHNCTECYLTFDARHKLKKHTREQYEDKFVKSPDIKSPKTEPKTNIRVQQTS